MTLCWLLGHDWNDSIVTIDDKKVRCCLKCAMIVVKDELEKDDEKDEAEE